MRRELRRTSVFQRFLTEYVKTAPFTSIGLEARLAYVKRTKSNLQLCYKSTNQLVKTTQITQGVLCARTAPLFLYNSCYLESSLSMSFAVVSGTWISFWVYCYTKREYRASEFKTFSEFLTGNFVVLRSWRLGWRFDCSRAVQVNLVLLFS